MSNRRRNLGTEAVRSRWGVAGRPNLACAFASVLAVGGGAFSAVEALERRRCGMSGSSLEDSRAIFNFTSISSSSVRCEAEWLCVCVACFEVSSIAVVVASTDALDSGHSAGRPLTRILLKPRLRLPVFLFKFSLKFSEYSRN